MVKNSMAVFAASCLACVFAWIGVAEPPASTPATGTAATQSNRVRTWSSTAGQAPLRTFTSELPHWKAEPLVRSETPNVSNTDFEAHLERLKQKLPHDDFHIVIQKPFVVIGDEAPEVVSLRAERTVKWAVELLKQEYFPNDPHQIIDIWLFKDKASYEQHNKQLFGSLPTTPFGFYSSANKALVMNISTGGGTLVHEIVHPFIESNFPDCPSWFNEGLASLYEQCGEKHDRIWGQTNWRLRGLQGVIKSGRLGSFEELCSTTSREFYDDDRGTNYAQARYLCYYLQEEGLLHDFYHKFRKNVDQDPSGYQTLSDTLGHPDMEEFERDWQAFVLKLRF